MYIYSLEHKQYLNKLRREKIIINISRLLIFITFLIIWEMLSRYKVINTFLFSSPSIIYNTCFNLFKEFNLFRHINVTLYEVLISFIITNIIGIIIASIMWRYKILSSR